MKEFYVSEQDLVRWIKDLEGRLVAKARQAREITFVPSVLDRLRAVKYYDDRRQEAYRELVRNNAKNATPK